MKEKLRAGFEQLNRLQLKSKLTPEIPAGPSLLWRAETRFDEAAKVFPSAP